MESIQKQSATNGGGDCPQTIQTIAVFILFCYDIITISSNKHSY